MTPTFEQYESRCKPYKVVGGGKAKFGVRQDDEIVYECDFDFPTAYLICDILNEIREVSPNEAYELDWEGLRARLEERGWEDPTEGEDQK